VDRLGIDNARRHVKLLGSPISFGANLEVRARDHMQEQEPQALLVIVVLNLHLYTLYIDFFFRTAY
jgi:hypothetical protein